MTILFPLLGFPVFKDFCSDPKMDLASIYQLFVILLPIALLKMHGPLQGLDAK
jgi:hypothetical protein